MCPSNESGERRRFPRYLAARVSTRLSWWDDEGPRISPALLLDISRGGALVVAEATPPERHPAWVRLAGGAPGCWIEATVVQVEATPQGALMVRLAFREPCPDQLFQAAADRPPAATGAEIEPVGRECAP
jgi:hypothetical protein